MRKYLHSVAPYLAMIVVLCVLVGYAFTGPYDFIAPGSHDIRLGPHGGLNAWHKPGHTDPYAVDPGDGFSCASCHGAALEGDGRQPPCYYCHGDLWTYDMTGYPETPNSDYLANPVQVYPDSHTVDVGNIMPLSKGDSMTACWFCHANIAHGGPAKTNFFHAPGHGTPYESGCTNCHGPNLDGVNGFAMACRWCHQNQWAGGGLPPDHENLDTYGNNLDSYGDPIDYGSELKGGLAWHRFGWANPYSIFERGVSPDGCTRCHGPNLNDGFAPSCFSCHGPGGGRPLDHTEDLGGFGFLHALGYETPFDSGCTTCHGLNLLGPPPNDIGSGPSCYTCHGKKWAPHDFSGEPWLPPGENHCYVCHLPPAVGDSTPVWNHELSLAPGYTGTSIKCMGCHQGAPGPAINDFGGNTTGTYFVTGPDAFGTDLALHHPISFTYNSAFASTHGGLYDPATSLSGLTNSGTIEEDMLESGQLQCTACHDQHDNSKGEYLLETVDGGLCFKCHLPVSFDPTQHHIPGRGDPWGDTRGTIFNCKMCHGETLDGTADAPACTDCHNPFTFPDPPLPGHHGGDRTKPYFDCAVCHADPLTGVVTGNDFGTGWAPSCYQCHDDSWNVGNQPPVNVSMADLSGNEGEAITFDASHIIDPEADPIALQWNFGDGTSPGFPSHESTATHTYADFGDYTATLAVTDGVNPPQSVQFQVIVSPATANPVVDAWTIEVSDATPTVVETFGMTFENHSGSLVAVKDDGSLSFGVEFVGVIFWMDIWMDLSGNVFWGTGDTFFGNIDRATGTMSGVVFDDEGSVRTFSGVVP